MATLTYDPSEADTPEFSEAEQESINIGQQLEDAQSEMLAGKYRNAEELEQGYIELQQKLGEQNNGQEGLQDERNNEEEVVDELPEDVSDVSTDFLEQLWTESLDEFSPDTLEQLQNMEPTDIADMYLAYRQQNADAELSQGDVDALYGIAGGQDEYNSMIGWAQTALGENEVAMYDSVMQKGDPAACFFAVQALKSIYQENAGYEGQMLGGSSAPDMVDAYRSQAEMIRDMSDPRYDNDPAFRNDVMEKLSRSNDVVF
tara:strand:+ start:162 stop:938 length:777 start_codon:yes stop_codon:yes gene_type:complete